VLKQHKINVTMMKNGRQERGRRPGVRNLLEIMGMEADIISCFFVLCLD